MIPALPPSLRCIRTPQAIVSKISDERAAAALPGDPVFDVPARDSGVQDAAAYPGARAVWFQGHAGGAGNGEYAEFDPSRHVLARCVHADTVQIVQIVSAQSAPDFIPRGSLSFTTMRGLRIGSTLADVQRVYGRMRPRPTAQGDVYAYTRRIPLPHGSMPYVVNTIFVVRNGRVTAISRLQGI